MKIKYKRVTNNDIFVLQENEFFSEDGIPKNVFPNGWKGKAGLYAVGFTKRGLSGASLDAVNVAHDIAKAWKEETKQKICFYLFWQVMDEEMRSVLRRESQIALSYPV